MAIRDHLRNHRIHFEILLHRPATGATRLAQSLRIPGRQVAKAVLVAVDSGFVLAVLPATHRIVFERLGEVLAVSQMRLADPHEVERIFHDCEPGSLPPFGSLYGLKTVVDVSLSGVTRIIAEGNLRHEGLRLKYRDFEAVEGPLRGRFAEQAQPPRRRPARRKAS